LPTITADNLRRLMHELRESVGAFAIHLSKLADGTLDSDGRDRIDKMRANARQMDKALAEIVILFGLDTHEASGYWPTVFDTWAEEWTALREPKSIKAQLLDLIKRELGSREDKLRIKESV
jgi:hypothetical protein